ncbi:MAG: barstar family protein [Rhodospirillales bacterium]|nr:barstar family protein [Alphaproteobacteria bacterium]MCB1838760.1 barstar family protein [Alphaproteobacteria bacterium]MCB9977286.1 barstar family protein [Rhodospirillales bacterium]
MVWHVVQINCDAITDVKTFHQEFAAAFGFPNDYAGTKEAWLLRLAKLDDVNDRVTEVYCDPGEVITVELLNVASFARRCPEEFTFCVEGISYINWARLEEGMKPILAIAFYGVQTYDLSGF